MFGNSAAGFFKPLDGLVGTQFQHMHKADELIPGAELGIARADADGLLQQRYYLLRRPAVEFANGEAAEYGHPIPIGRERSLILGNSFSVPGLCAQYHTFR